MIFPSSTDSKVRWEISQSSNLNVCPAAPFDIVLPITPPSRSLRFDHGVFYHTFGKALISVITKTNDTSNGTRYVGAEVFEF